MSGSWLQYKKMINFVAKIIINLKPQNYENNTKFFNLNRNNSNYKCT